MVIFSVPRFEWPGEEPLFELDSNKRCGQNVATVQIIPLNNKVKSGALGQLLHSPGDHKRAPEQKLSPPAAQNWNGLGMGRYSSRIRINVGGKNVATIQVIPGPFLKSGLGSLARYSTHEETISGGPEQKYLPSDPRWNVLQKGRSSSLHAFVSFKLPIPTNKTVNITLLPQKSEKRCKRDIT